MRRIFIFLSICFSLNAYTQYLNRILPTNYENVGVILRSYHIFDDTTTNSINVVYPSKVNGNNAITKSTLSKSTLTVINSQVILQGDSIDDFFHLEYFKGKSGKVAFAILHKLAGFNTQSVFLNVRESGEIIDTLFIKNSGDKFPTTTYFDDDFINVALCRTSFPFECDYVKYDYSGQLLDQKIIYSDSLNIVKSFIPRHSLPAVGNDSLILLVSQKQFQFSYFSKTSWDTASSFSINLQTLLNNYGIVDLENYNAFLDNTGELILTGSVERLKLGFAPVFTYKQGFLARFDANFNITEMQFIGAFDSTQAKTTNIFGTTISANNTMMLVGSTPYSGWANALENREIFLARKNQFGFDSLLIFANGNHNGIHVLEDENNDVYVLTVFFGSDQKQYIDVLKVSQYAIGLGRERSANSKLYIFPNPTTEWLQIEANGLNPNGMPYKIVNMNGQRVQTGIWEDTRINVEQLPNGQYMLLLEHPKGVERVLFQKQ